VGDLNGDGFPDLVSPTGITIDIYLNDGGGGFSQGISLATIEEGATSAAIADIDGDGIADLVVGEHTTAEIFPGKGDGTFRAAAPLPLPDSGFGWGDCGGIAVADFDSDGNNDIALVGFQSSVAVILQSDGGFSSAFYPNPNNLFLGGLVVLPSTNGPPDLALAEFNPYGGGVGLGLQIFKNSGDGSFMDGGWYPPPANLNVGIWLAAGDFNQDGILDLVISGPEVAVYYGAGDGTFDYPVTLLTADGGGLAGVAPLGPASTPRALGVADFNGGGLTVLGDPSKH
jgi:hypothetical protein